MFNQSRFGESMFERSMSKGNVLKHNTGGAKYV